MNISYTDIEMATKNLDTVSPFSPEGYAQLKFGNDDYVLNR